MKKKHIKKIVVLIIIASLIIFILIPVISNANFDPNNFNFNSDSTADTILSKWLTNLQDKIGTLGSIVSVIALIIIGIRYVLGSVEEKADYKERMEPYIIGAAFVFSISTIVNLISDISKSVSSSGSIEDAGNIIITILATIGSIVSVVGLIALGLKYMGGSIEEKAEYKRSMKPYIIGCLLIFAASNLASMVYNTLKEMK